MESCSVLFGGIRVLAENIEGFLSVARVACALAGAHSSATGLHSPIRVAFEEASSR